MTCRIQSLTACHVLIPLRRRIAHASHARDETHTLLVRCRLQDGTTGWGEGLPRPYVTGETIDSAWRIIEDAPLADQLGGEISGLAELVERCRNLQLLAKVPGERDCLGHSARCALELAVLDAVLKSTRRRFQDLVQAIPEAAPLVGRTDAVRYSAAFTGMSARKQYLSAMRWLIFGFRVGKAKVGLPTQDDVSTLSRIRFTMGPDFDLRIDANEAWNSANLVEKVRALQRFQISSLEQPLPHAELRKLPALRRQIEIPLMLDESLCSLSDADQAIETQACDLFNIRLSKCGGFIPSVLLAARAQRAGLGFQLGCQVGETGILSAAGRQFATNLRGWKYLEGSFDRYLVRERLTAEDLTFKYGGRAPAITGCGLGVHVDEAAVKRVLVREMTIPIAR